MENRDRNRYSERYSWTMEKRNWEVYEETRITTAFIRQTRKFFLTAISPRVWVGKRFFFYFKRYRKNLENYIYGALIIVWGSWRVSTPLIIIIFLNDKK